MTLRPYQSAALDSLRKLVRRGVRRICVVLPTGGGKTVLFSHLIASFLERSQQPVIVIVHRRELVDQTLAKLASVGVQAGVVMGSDRRASTSPVQVCSVQTMQRRLDRLPPAGLVIYDECHHAAAAGSREVLSRYPDALLLGFTATPWRADALGLADVFTDSVLAATPRELQALGALVQCDPYAYDAPDLHDVPMVAGDYSPKALGEACNTSVLVGSVVTEYQAHTPGRRAICFPVNVAHSQALVGEFTAAGVTARHIDWSTPADERSATLRGLADGSVLVVSSVGVLTEGFDCPAAEVCILARPTQSLSLYLQMVGRVLRPAANKSVAIIHDHAGNVFRHGFPEDDRDYSLTATPQRILDVWSCTDCHALVSRWRDDGTCPKCGSLQHMPAVEREAIERRRGKDPVAGVRLSRAQLEAVIAEAKCRGRDLTLAQAAKLARATREDRAAEYLRLVGVAKRKGFRDGFVAHEYRRTFGKWPRFQAADLEGIQPAAKPFLPLPPREPKRPDLPVETTHAAS